MGIPSCFLPPISKQEEKSFRVPWENQKIKHSHPQTTWKQNGRPNNPWLHVQMKLRHYTFAIFVFCLIYHTIWDSSKNWEVWELQKRKRLRQLMSTFGFLFQVTCLSLHRRLRSEASVGEVCFDVVLASCCKGKRIPEIKFTKHCFICQRQLWGLEIQAVKWQKIIFSGLVAFSEYLYTAKLFSGEGIMLSKS